MLTHPLPVIALSQTDEVQDKAPSGKQFVSVVFSKSFSSPFVFSQTSPVQKARQTWMCTLPAALEVEQHSLIGGEAVMDPTVAEAFKTEPLYQSPEVQKKLQGFFPETWGFDYVEVVPASSSFEASGDGGGTAFFLILVSVVRYRFSCLCWFEMKKVQEVVNRLIRHSKKRNSFFSADCRLLRKLGSLCCMSLLCHFKKKTSL